MSTPSDSSPPAPIVHHLRAMGATSYDPAVPRLLMDYLYGQIKDTLIRASHLSQRGGDSAAEDTVDVNLDDVHLALKVATAPLVVPPEVRGKVGGGGETGMSGGRLTKRALVVGERYELYMQKDLPVAVDYRVRVGTKKCSPLLSAVQMCRCTERML